MSTFMPFSARLGRVGLAFAALILTAAASPASAQERFQDRYPFREHRWECNPGENCVTRRHQHRWRHHDNDGFFSFGLGGGSVYSDPGYYYAPPPQYYEPPPVYYPQPRYYQPGPSFNFSIPLGD